MTSHKCAMIKRRMDARIYRLLGATNATSATSAVLMPLSTAKYEDEELIDCVVVKL